MLEAFDVHWRRLVEVVVDFGLICGAFLASYVVTFGGFGTANQKNVFWAVLPVLLAARYVAFILFGLYRSIWRYAARATSSRSPRRRALRGSSRSSTWSRPATLGDFALRIFALDALLCVALVVGVAVRRARAPRARDRSAGRAGHARR